MHRATMAFDEYEQYCTAEEKALLEHFFADFSAHCLLRSREKYRLQSDFESAILHYIGQGMPLKEALTRLDVSNLGGFYARPPVLWFPLDDAAKIYPLSMTHGRMTLFRLSVYLKTPVVPTLLQMALNFTIKRFPSFATTLKKGFFWHYLDTAKRRYNIEEEQGIPCRPLKVSKSGSPTFRVLYYNNRISVEFFHVLTDGVGGMTFLKVLTSEYLRLTGIQIPPDESIWDINATPLNEEFENAFARIPKKGPASGFVDKTAVQMSGKLSVTKPCRILHFKLPAAELKAAAKAYNATVTAYMLARMYQAAKAATDEIEGEMSIQVPVNMRKFYPTRSLRNFSMYCGIRLPVQLDGRMEELIPLITDQLNTKGDKEPMSEMVRAASTTVRLLKYIPLCVKYPAATLAYGFLGDTIFTTTLSNLGVVQLPPAMAQQIDCMDFILGTGINNRLSCSMITVSDTAVFSISKITADPSFEEKLYSLLSADGIAVTVEGSELYEY